jgi:hypothetical protein
MPSFSIAVDLSHLMSRGTPLNASVMPHLAFAVQSILDRAEVVWKQFASGSRPLPGGRTIHVRSGEYLRSINQRKTGDFSGVVETFLPRADTIEKGAPARDMHDLLASSLKVRISSKTGKRYLIIPFRHSPNANNVMRDNFMPAAVHDWWKTATPSSVRSGYERRPVHSNLVGALKPENAVYRLKGGLLTVPQRRYDWGDRLTADHLRAMKMNESQVRRMQGMYNFRRPGKKGGAAHSQYITFRTMVEGSPGWRVPAREGYWPAKTTANMLQPVAEERFKRAVEADIRGLLP